MRCVGLCYFPWHNHAAFLRGAPLNSLASQPPPHLFFFPNNPRRGLQSKEVYALVDLQWRFEFQLMAVLLLGLNGRIAQ